MFYLKEFFKSIGESPFRGLSFVFFSCLLSFGLTHRNWLSETVQKITPEKMVSPYFVTILDSEVDVRKIKSVLSGLPGVIAIDEAESLKSKRKLASLVKQLGSEYALDSKLLEFKSLKVLLNPTLSSESLEFIRGAAIKTGGKDHVNATDIKFPEITSSMSTHPFYAFLKRFGDWGIITILTFCWGISYWLCYDVFRSRSYIVEKFQRKKYVAPKAIASGVGFIFLIFNALGIWHGTLKVTDTLILFMILSVFWTFSMQDWRWKPTL